MTRFLLLTSVQLLSCAMAASCLANADRNEGAFRLHETTLALAQVDLDAAQSIDASGYPRLDPARVDLTKITERGHRAVILENRYSRVVILPEMGRVISLFDKLSGHEQLWTNRIARPLFNQRNELGWWMVWGGVEYTVPAGEHGTTWALPWQARVIEDTARRKAVFMRVLEPKTKLEQSVLISMVPESAAFEAEIKIRNTSDRVVRFSHWVNPMWSPGGRNELTANTEFIVASEQMLVAERDFTAWMLGHRVQPWRDNPLRFAANWRDIGDLAAVRLTNGFYSAFCHAQNEGVARVFDHRACPGMNIWTWGFPPPPQRQKEYSLTPNLGYVEMWGGTVPDFSDAALKPIGPGESVTFTEWMYPYRQTGGLTVATKDLAAKFHFTDAS
ncbi:MAG TPA: DUF5107 domain-containing protein, partial [Prosthecobacter sp.]|nr:DUF5107 domain-containing protein [Prosthecobacter sp.]